MDPKRVDLQQDLEHVVVQDTILSLETLARHSSHVWCVYEGHLTLLGAGDRQRTSGG